MSANSQFTMMVHVLTLLGKAERPLSSRWIAGSVNTNPVVIRQIVRRLHEVELVDTLPGSTGGAVLKQDPAQITLKEIYRLTKNETFFGLHPNEPSPYCPVGRNIQSVLIEVFDQMDQLVENALGDITIADIIAQVSQREAARAQA
ncbi:MAG TPA: Rrf2 family transcriptional regulator [Anaerolineae bacterium]|nr:Rrf2 family transcriptional regulator [Anaerolineae bacterium]HQI85541.1 Rrf2 family transcriptional regulator [Anaerolineae bacterium]